MIVVEGGNSSYPKISPQLISHLLQLSSFLTQQVIQCSYFCDMFEGSCLFLTGYFPSLSPVYAIKQKMIFQYLMHHLESKNFETKIFADR